MRKKNQCSLVLNTPISHDRAGAQVKLRTRKVWRLEKKLFTPDMVLQQKITSFHLFGDSLYH